MLKFDRKEFKSGVIVCKEIVPEPDGQTAKLNIHKFYYKDKGKTFSFENEAYMLEKYPVLFTQVTD